MGRQFNPEASCDSWRSDEGKICRAESNQFNGYFQRRSGRFHSFSILAVSDAARNREQIYSWMFCEGSLQQITFFWAAERVAQALDQNYTNADLCKFAINTGKGLSVFRRCCHSSQVWAGARLQLQSVSTCTNSATAGMCCVCLHVVEILSRFWHCQPSHVWAEWWRCFSFQDQLGAGSRPTERACGEPNSHLCQCPGSLTCVSRLWPWLWRLLIGHEESELSGMITMDHGHSHSQSHSHTDTHTAYSDSYFVIIFSFWRPLISVPCSPLYHVNVGWLWCEQ